MTPAWSEAAIPDLTGITAVVTGASGGIGLQVARGLASKRAHAVLGVRPTGRGQAAATTIRRARPGAPVEVMALDLADLASIHRFAETPVIALRRARAAGQQRRSGKPFAAADRRRLRAGFRHQPPGPLRADRPPAARDALLAEGPRDHRDEHGLTGLAHPGTAGHCRVSVSAAPGRPGRGCYWPPATVRCCGQPSIAAPAVTRRGTPWPPRCCGPGCSPWPPGYGPTACRRGGAGHAHRRGGGLSDLAQGGRAPLSELVPGHPGTIRAGSWAPRTGSCPSFTSPGSAPTWSSPRCWPCPRPFR